MSSPWAVLTVFKNRQMILTGPLVQQHSIGLKPGMEEGDGEWRCEKNTDSGGRQVL